MTTALLILALSQPAPLSYDFKPGTKLQYEMSVAFEGLIPILGGQEGKAVVQLGVEVLGQAPKDDRLKVSSELTSATFIFNDAKLPLGLDNVKDFFPKTNIEITPQGKILKTDAPDISLPVKLPGLDVKRFPDISYLPMEFPTDKVEVGTLWKYTKNFGGSDVSYECEAVEMSDGLITIQLKLSQDYTVLENAALEVVEKEEDAEARVVTTMRGTGKAVFDGRRKVMKSFSANAKATSGVSPLHGGEKSTRTLSTSLKVELKSPN